MQILLAHAKIPCYSYLTETKQQTGTEMFEFEYDRSETSDKNALRALKMFPFLGQSGADNLISWMESKLSVRGAITWSEIETLEGLIY
jgi:hypothetical protein